MYGLPPPQGSPSLAQFLDAAYPVGSIYISTSSTNPGTTFGVGTWAAFGAGQVLVGVDSEDEDFNTAENTGGEKFVQLGTSELPAHTHGLPSGESCLIDNGGGVEAEAGDSGYYAFDTISDITETESAGADSPHNNMPPYIVVYMWKRTA